MKLPDAIPTDEMETRKNDNTNLPSQQPFRNATVLVAAASFAILICFGAFITLHYRASYTQTLPLISILAIASVALLLGMSGFYLYAFSFYLDPIYVFFAIGWLGNAAYIFIDRFYIIGADPDYNILIYIFSLLSLLPFYLSSFITKHHTFSYKHATFRILAWLAWVSMAFYLPLPIGPTYRFAVVTALGGIPWTMWVLIKAGRLMQSHLSQGAHGEWSRLFPATFYLYAALQPLSIFEFSATARLLLSVAFAAGLTIKIVNCICLVAIMQRDFAALRERLGTQTILEELGILTASIEHDIKNPLQIIANDLTALKERFQSNPQIVNRANRIEEQRRRIYATTEIIRVLRGGEYYDNLMSKVSINQVLQRAVQAIKEESATTRVLFKVDGGPKYTRAYEPALQQAFVNILKNAVEAITDAPRQTGVVTIQIVDASVTTFLVRITDNGCGIRADDLPKLGKFFSTKKDRRPNSGIGLFISQRILTFHKGRMELDSVLHEGTTVSVFLPSWHAELEI